jgi:hypothetical protein
MDICRGGIEGGCAALAGQCADCGAAIGCVARDRYRFAQVIGNLVCPRRHLTVSPHAVGGAIVAALELLLYGDCEMQCIRLHNITDTE